MIKIISNQRGFAALFITLLILAVIFGIAISLTVLILGQERISGNIVKSSQAYFTAEAGIEDALLRLSKKMKWSSPYNLNVGGASTTIEISDVIGSSRTITSKGNFSNRIRKVQIVYEVSTQQISFYYGAQVGDGGMEMGNNAVINGNVFSNGSVISVQKGDVQDTIKVATIGSKIEGLIIGKDAYAHNCKDCTIRGALYYSGGSLEKCDATGGQKTHPVQGAKDLPIPESQINQWKQETAGGGEIDKYELDGKVTGYLGPKKITGNMLLDNKAILVMTGTIWVVGDITIRNGAGIRLDLSSYGGLSGILIADGKIKIRPGVTLEGSGEKGSYLLILSTNASLDAGAPAIDIDNTTAGGIFYTPNTYAGTNGGLIVIRNKVAAREVTGHKVYLEENAEINYEAGLEDAEFSTGPGGSWEVVSWKEIE